MRALLIVDAQYDFMPGGALAVKGGDEIVPVINDLMPYFNITVASQDWHPADHCSFAAEPKFADKSWPRHCVQSTIGAMIHKDIKLGHALGHGKTHLFVHKGTGKDVEQYSAFDGFVFSWEKETKGKGYDPVHDSLAPRLRALGVTEVHVCGLAAEYCVKATVLDSIKNGFKTLVVAEAVRGITPEGYEKAFAEMGAAGASFVMKTEDWKEGKE